MKKWPKLLAAVKVSKTLKNSPVNYIVALMEMYFQGEIDRVQLRVLFKDLTKDAQFFFFRMPEKQVEENRRFFRQEFILADQMWKTIGMQSYTMDDAELKAALEEHLEEYLRAISQKM